MVRGEAAAQRRKRDPQLAHDVDRHAVVREDDREEDEVEEEARDLGRKVDEEEPSALGLPLALEVHVDQMEHVAHHRRERGDREDRVLEPEEDQDRRAVQHAEVSAQAEEEHVRCEQARDEQREPRVRRARRVVGLLDVLDAALY